MQNHPWLKIQAFDHLLQWEIYVVILSVAFGVWLFYKIFLRDVNGDRHRGLQRSYRKLIKLIVFFSLLFGSYSALYPLRDSDILIRLLPYLGLVTLFCGSIVFIQSAHIMVLQYLFRRSMNTGVPLLLVNIFTLLLSLFLFGWILASLFEIHLGPLLATSAALSIVLGLALQDTLGNLFAGISLQMDHSFSIGNWVEMKIGGDKVTGKIEEITWRSTVLVGFTEELIIVPNRIVAQSQLHNWTRPNVPIIRSQVFRLPFHVDVAKVKEALGVVANGITQICKDPEPLVIITELGDSALGFKLVYYIHDFGSQYIVNDHLITAGLVAFQKLGYQPAISRLQIDLKT